MPSTKARWSRSSISAPSSRSCPAPTAWCTSRQLANHRVTKVTDVVKEGDILKVKVLEISKDGKIRLSHKAVLEDEDGSRRSIKPSWQTGFGSLPEHAPRALRFHGGLGECRGPGRNRCRKRAVPFHRAHDFQGDPGAPPFRSPRNSMPSAARPTPSPPWRTPATMPRCWTPSWTPWWTSCPTSF